jgi:sodium/potassium-transporting ATPase subunit alpha
MEFSKKRTDCKEILRFVVIIGTVSVTFASIVVIVWAAYLRHTHPEALSTTQLLITTISVLIAVIPEGLPVSVTLALTVIAKALGNSKVLCKSLSTVETLGAVNVLCSDKTGTLTQNKMFVQTASVLDEEFSTMEAQSAILKQQSPPSVGLEQLQLIAGLCNAAQFDAADNGLPVSQRRINGDATDAAILRFAEELGSVNSLHEGWKMVFDLPFNSKIKYMVLTLA